MSVQEPPRIALVRQGDTPIVNTRLASVVASAFPDHVVDDIDVLAELRRRRPVAALVAAAAFIEHGADLVLRRTDRKRALLTSAAFTRFARGVVRRRVPQQTRFVLQSQSLFAADVPGVPHVVYTDHVHLANLAYPGFDRRRLLPRGFLRRERDLYHRSAAILVRSSNIRDLLRHGYGVEPHRVSVVGVGPNAPVAPSPPADRAWHGGRIVFIGIDWDRKGGPVLLDAFVRIRDRYPTARLEIVGPERTEGDPPGVICHGRLPVAEVAALLDSSDVFCLPTLAEPFGVVFVEAMLAGLPVVGTHLGAQPDFILPGRTGELVPPNDVAALARALDRLLGDPERTLRMGRCAAALAHERYTWASVGTKLRAAIDHSLDPPSATSSTDAAGDGSRPPSGALA